MKKTYTQSAEEVLQELGVGACGLSAAQAQERLAKYGPNKLKEAEKPTLLLEAPFLANAFSFVPVGLAEYAIGLGLGFVVIPIVEAVKFIQRKLGK